MTTSSALLEKIEASLRKAESQVSAIRRANTRAVVVALGASALSTLLTAIPAAAAQPLMSSWRVTCLLAAVCSALATLTIGLRTQLRYGERFGSATECLGQLRGLQVQASAGLLPAEAVSKQYAETVAKYPEFV